MDSSVVFAVVACVLAAFYLLRRLSRGKAPPGPIGFPFLGYIPYLSRMPHLDFQRLAKKYGNIFSLQLGSMYVVILNDYESTKEAFSLDALIGRPDESPFDLNRETLETGAFNGLPWKEQRRFSLHMLKDLGFAKTKMEGHMQEQIDELLEILGKNEGKPFCIYESLASSMSNNISALVFGKRFKYNDPTRSMLNRVIRDSAAAAGQAAWQLFFPTVKKVFQFLGIGDIDRVNRVQKEMRSYIQKEMEEHEKTLDPNNIRDYIDGYLVEIKKRNDPAFCKPVLEDMVGTFFGAGSETVRLSLEWLILTAATHQNAQRRVQKEIDQVVGRTRPPTWLDQKSMPYTQAFINELMRWKTIVPINIVRYALEDAEVGGFHIRKHSQVISNLWAIHHEPGYWGSDAEQFKPERFLTEDGKEVKKFEHFIPFSVGKRACPGEPLAKMEVFLYFTSILQRFKVRLPDGKDPDFEGTLGIGLVPKPQELIYTKRD